MICFHLPAPGCRAIHFSRLRPSRFSGTRKRSVPVRVHSVPKSFGFTSHACAWPASNPFLTHGTVESPAKLLPLQITAKVTECDRLQSVLRAVRQPLSLAGGRAPKFKFSLLRRGLPKNSMGVVIGFPAHHMPGRLGQLAGQRFGRNHVAGLGRLAVVPLAALLVVAPRKVGRLHKSPGQILVATFGIVLAFLL